MEQELRRLGFDKIVMMKGPSEGELRPSKEHIEAQLKGLLADVGKDDTVLVMLSGHGQELKVKVRAPDGGEIERDDGFYCPVNAVLNEPDTMVSLSYLTDDLLAKWGGKNLVLLDACRDGVVDLDKGVRARGVQGRVVSLPEGRRSSSVVRRGRPRSSATSCATGYSPTACSRCSAPKPQAE